MASQPCDARKDKKLTISYTVKSEVALCVARRLLHRYIHFLGTLELDALSCSVEIAAI